MKPPYLCPAIIQGCTDNDAKAKIWRALLNALLSTTQGGEHTERTPEAMRGALVDLCDRYEPAIVQAVAVVFKREVYV